MNCPNGLQLYSQFFYKHSRDGGLVISVLVLYCNNSSSNPAEVYSFFWKMLVTKNEYFQKEAAGVGSFKKLKCRLQSPSMFEHAPMTLSDVVVDTIAENVVKRKNVFRLRSVKVFRLWRGALYLVEA